MVRLQESRFGFLFRLEAFLMGFVLLAVLNAVLAWLMPAPGNPLSVRLISVFVYGVLGWFTYRKQPVATWVLCFLMLFSGVGSLTAALAALFAGGEGQLGMKLLNLFVGGYFSYGAIVVFLNRPTGQGG